MRTTLTVLTTTSVVLLAATTSFLPGCTTSTGEPEETVATTSSALDDSFYTAPSGWQTKANGAVLKYQSVTVPGNLTTNYEFMVRSSDQYGNPIPVVATLMIPGSYDGPLVAFSDAIDSLGQNCNPSYTLQAGTCTGLVGMQLALDESWAVVAVDYEGMNVNYYGAGKSEGRGILDAIIGAETLPKMTHGVSTKVGLWGYSGGGTATAWAAQLASSYAPQLDIVGAAFGGTPQGPAWFEGLDGSNTGLMAIGMVGISREYTSLPPLFNAAGKSMATSIGTMCGAAIESDPLFASPATVEQFVNVSPLWTNPTVEAVFKDLTLGLTKPSMPLMIYNGSMDLMVPVQSAEALVNSYCSLGAHVDWVDVIGGGHVTVPTQVASGNINWLMDQFLGWGDANNCP